jgi:hypothetical protein
MSTDLGSSRTILATSVPIAMFDCSFDRDLGRRLLLVSLSSTGEGRIHINNKETCSYQISRMNCAASFSCERLT